MRVTRREFLKYCSVAAGALGLSAATLFKLKETLAKEGGIPIVWLHGASCSGDSISLLNTIFYTDPVGLLVTDGVDLEFHQTVMNTSGTDLPNATDSLIEARLHLPISIDNYAGWSTETWSDGYESIKLTVGNRSDPLVWVDAKVHPVTPLLLNEFSISFKFKTSEKQAPYIELDLENQDTGDTRTISSHYPGIDATDVPWVAPPSKGIFGATDWHQVSTHDFALWRLGSVPPAALPGLGTAPYVTLADMKQTYNTWKITRVRIVNRGNAVYGTVTLPCTIYVDNIMVGGIAYEDESDSITFNAEPEPVEGPFVLAIEGSILTATPLGGTLAGQFCEVGPMVRAGDPDETMLHAFLEYAKAAQAVLAIGTCASYGGIPAATGSVTGAKGCSAVLKEYGITTPVINIPGCPAHPDWIVGTIVQYLSKGLAGIELDAQGRPRDYYPHYVCNGNIDVQCPWVLNAGGQSQGLAYRKWGSVPAGPGDTYDAINYPAGHMYEGCLGDLGCRGRKTKADCAYRKWNANATLTPGILGVNWCVGSRGGCQGCTDPNFPSDSRFYTFI